MGFSIKSFIKKVSPLSLVKQGVDSFSGKNAAERASAAQTEAANAGIQTQKDAATLAREDLQPFVQRGLDSFSALDPYQSGGAQAFQQQQNILGLGDPGSQQAAYDAMAQSPQFQAMQQQGENAMLQNASATGGLRGGNMQAALAQFSPELLNNLMQQQYSNLGGLAGAGLQTAQNAASMGQASAAGQAAQGLQTGANIAGLQGQVGAAEAGKQNAIQAGRMGLLNMGIQGGKAAMGMF
tara:strand:- start:407 stop:1123 length:717 start_codon:yes stop_codon:yes gene_type:complete